MRLPDKEVRPDSGGEAGDIRPAGAITPAGSEPSPAEPAATSNMPNAEPAAGTPESEPPASEPPADSEPTAPTPSEPGTSPTRSDTEPSAPEQVTVETVTMDSVTDTAESAATEPAQGSGAEPEAPVRPTADAPADQSPPETIAADEVKRALSALAGRLDDLAGSVAEVARLRTRDTDLITRMHDDVTRLRTGEIAVALSPAVNGMIRLHDQMVSLGALSDPASPVGMLHTQLLQILELTCGVEPFSPARGDRFDASRHTGVRRIATTDPSADGTIASTIKTGFARADGSVVRVAEVEVHRLAD